MTTNDKARGSTHGLHLDSFFVPAKDFQIMTLDNADRQRLREATRKHRSRLGLDPATGKAANTITRRSALAAVFAGIASRFGMRGSK